jgi:hypothetical protein
LKSNQSAGRKVSFIFINFLFDQLLKTIQQYPLSLLRYKGTVQQKLTGVLSGITRKLMISSIAARYIFLKFKGPCPFKFKGALFGVLINFRVAILDTMACAD